MAKSIKLTDIGSYAESQYEKLLRATVLETDRRVKFGSPVDTGRFRVSWAIGQNAAPYQGAPAGGSYGSAPPNAVNYALGQEKPGNVYSIHNNLPYAEPLAFGHSKQAPAGWVDGIANDLRSWVQSQAANIGRTS